ncbi:ATPase with chaperone activity [Ramlibacter sp. MAHUQ-53]|uniref:ATPase with chaperone activity n=1 Tax=unclassified Ramlibacter TaxID=2617605 RepID=UPI003634A8B7
MDDSHQIEVPPSFTQLYAAPGGYKLTEPMAAVRERYELCEDLTQMLTEQASNTLHALGITEIDVLEKMGQALAAPGSPVQPAEARWVVRRLAELLHWEDPGPGAA